MKNIRKNIHFIQKELSIISGVSKSSVCHGENGSRPVPFAVTQQISRLTENAAAAKIKQEAG